MSRHYRRWSKVCDSESTDRVAFAKAYHASIQELAPTFGYRLDKKKMLPSGSVK
jgi:hypothetical protein